MRRLLGINRYPARVGRGAGLGIILAIAFSGPVVAAIAPIPPTPDEGTTFDFFVGDQYTYDDNLYRIPASFGPVASVIAPNATRADRINTVSLGGTGQWVVGRQLVDLTLRLDNSQFAHNTDLNNTGGDALLNWNWELGPYFSGQAGAEYNRALASFAETRYLGRDLVGNADYYASAKYQLGPRWAIFGGVRDSDIQHGATAAQFNNFRTKSGNVGVQFATGIADTFGLEYRYTDGSFPPNFTFDNVPFNRNFKEDTYRGTVHYAFSDKTSVDAYAGYMKHTLPSDNILPSSIFGNFSGDIWRMTVNWLPTEKTQVAVAGWHELHAYLVNASNYFLSKGVSISPMWRPTEKVTLAVVLSQEDQDYIAINTVLGLAQPPRFDKVTAEQINVYYIPRERWAVNLFFRNEHRASNESDFSYGDKLAQLSVTYKFW